MSRGPKDRRGRFFAELRVLPGRFAGDVADGLRAFQQGMNTPGDRRLTQFTQQPGWTFLVFGIIAITFALSVILTLMVRQ